MARIMARISGPLGAAAKVVAWLDDKLMALVAGEGRRLRDVIGNTAALARATKDPIRTRDDVPGMIATTEFASGVTNGSRARDRRAGPQHRRRAIQIRVRHRDRV